METTNPFEKIKPAPMTARLSAYLIEGILLGVLFFMLGYSSWVFLVFLGVIIACEVSEWRASPGKMLMGIKVYFDSEPILPKAILRNMIKTISHAWFFGFFMVWFGPTKKTLHDYAAETRVIVADNDGLSPARRSTAFLLVISALFLSLGLWAYYQYRPWFDARSVEEILELIATNEIDEEGAKVFVNREFHPQFLSDPYGVVFAKDVYDLRGKSSVVVLAAEQLPFNKFEIDGFWEVSKRNPVVVLAMEPDQKDIWLRKIINQFHNSGFESQSVEMTVGTKAVGFLRYVNKDPKHSSKIGYLSRIDEHKWIFALGYKDTLKREQFFTWREAIGPFP